MNNHIVEYKLPKSYIKYGRTLLQAELLTKQFNWVAPKVAWSVVKYLKKKINR
jgi:hypothetical protein